MRRMLFNATHPEELRVAIVNGQKLVDIDVETAGRELRKGNIYKGVISRIEPSLEACFVNYGHERHGFLPFKAIAPTCYPEGVDPQSVNLQDVLSVGQELIIQVEKEERGNKGAALTTYISLAGRFLVLMPNNPRGGGVSRRIEGEDRKELRENMDQLPLPEGMSIIARTAGIGRDTNDLEWDLNYLLKLWFAIKNAADRYPGPVLIYQESSLVIRAIRDYFSPNIGEILIDTESIYEQVKAFMQDVMPENLPKVKLYRQSTPLFNRFQTEHQLKTAYARNVQLPSGGSIVIDHSEALVAIDVNSARANTGADIEETAFRTNLEAAEEVARQMRLRDLGGLIVIDFIDMSDSQNQREVEQTLRNALHLDRARVQMGKISRFGLMELSRQRLRPTLGEGSSTTCPRCNGTGIIRDVESSALHIFRLIQEEALKINTGALYVQVPVDVATFLLNEKRADIVKLENTTNVRIYLIPSKHLETPHHHIERVRHDDPRMDEQKLSLELVPPPKEETPKWQERRQEDRKRPEALIKGIPRDTPAPKPSEKKSAKHNTANPSVSLWKRFIGWLMAPTQASTASQTEPKPAKNAKAAQPNKAVKAPAKPATSKAEKAPAKASAPAKPTTPKAEKATQPGNNQAPKPAPKQPKAAAQAEKAVAQTEKAPAPAPTKPATPKAEKAAQPGNNQAPKPTPKQPKAATQAEKAVAQTEKAPAPAPAKPATPKAEKVAQPGNNQAPKPAPKQPKAAAQAEQAVAQTEKAPAPAKPATPKAEKAAQPGNNQAPKPTPKPPKAAAQAEQAVAQTEKAPTPAKPATPKAEKATQPGNNQAPTPAPKPPKAETVAQPETAVAQAENATTQAPALVQATPKAEAIKTALPTPPAPQPAQQATAPTTPAMVAPFKSPTFYEPLPTDPHSKACHPYRRFHQKKRGEQVPVVGLNAYSTPDPLNTATHLPFPPPVVAIPAPTQAPAPSVDKGPRRRNQQHKVPSVAPVPPSEPVMTPSAEAPSAQATAPVPPSEPIVTPSAPVATETLVQIETLATASEATGITPSVKLGRPRKSAQFIADTALEQVETKR